MLAWLVVGLLSAILVVLQMREPKGSKQGLGIRRNDAPSFIDNDKEVKDVHFLKDLLKSSALLSRGFGKINEACQNVHPDCKDVITEF